MSVGQRKAGRDEDSCTGARREANTTRAIETETDNLAETATQTDRGSDRDREYTITQRPSKPFNHVTVMS